jgi:predicted nucleic acid-binding protein
VANSPRRAYCDTSVFLEYFRQDPAQPYFDAVKDLFDRAHEREFQILYSVLAITEASYVAERELEGFRFVGGALEDMDNIWDDYPTFQPIDTNRWIARKARELRRWQRTTGSTRIQNFDLVHMASAMFAKAETIYVIDKAWADYEKHIGIQILNPPTPRVVPPTLPFPP